ncbi:hypothetical protein EYS14_14920 [Alteromonadaceae bacterium M269]|nr:hypothetical protein EYS14_14920 [Alteromonadaceae bacterium M269]
MNESEMFKIMVCVEAYIKALYHADSVAMETLFHPEARYINTNEDGYVNYSRSDYIGILKDRNPPSATQSSLSEKIISLHLGGNTLAFVELSLVMMERQYLDFLTFTKWHGEWVIMNKAFSFTPTNVTTY